MKSMKTLALSSLLLWLPLAMASAQEPAPKDEKEDSAVVEKLIQDALARYRSGEAQQAVEKLQEAIALIEQSQKTGLASFLPPVPEGWEANEVDSQSMSFAAGGESGSQFLQITREYWPVAPDGSKGTRVSVSITNAPAMVQAQKAAAAVYKNPQILESMRSDPNRQVDLIEEGDWFGWKIVEEGQQGTVTAFCNSCLVTVNGNDAKTVEKIWGGFDLKGLSKSARPSKEPVSGDR